MNEFVGIIGWIVKVVVMIPCVFCMLVCITVMHIFTFTLRFKWIKLAGLKLSGFFYMPLIEMCLSVKGLKA